MKDMMRIYAFEAETFAIFPHISITAAHFYIGVSSFGYMHHLSLETIKPSHSIIRQLSFHIPNMYTEGQDVSKSKLF